MIFPNTEEGFPKELFIGIGGNNNMIGIEVSSNGYMVFVFAQELQNKPTAIFIRLIKNIEPKSDV